MQRDEKESSPAVALRVSMCLPQLGHSAADVAFWRERTDSKKETELSCSEKRPKNNQRAPY
jgi:hypothetical protein